MPKRKAVKWYLQITLYPEILIAFNIFLIFIIIFLIIPNHSKESNKQAKIRYNYDSYSTIEDPNLQPVLYPENYAWGGIDSCVNDRVNSYVSFGVYNYYNFSWKNKFIINGIEVPFELSPDASSNDRVRYKSKILKNNTINLIVFLNETYFANYSKNCIDLADYKSLR